MADCADGRMWRTSLRTRRVRAEVAHVAGVAALQPLGQEVELGIRLRPADAAEVEPQAQRLGLDRVRGEGGHAPVSQRARLPRLGELPHHVGQDAAVAVVVEFLRRVDAHAAVNVARRAVLGRRRDRQRRRAAAMPPPAPMIVDLLAAGQAERWPRSRRPGTAAAARPCRPGCSGGCARSSRRSPPARRAACVPLAAQSRDEPVPYSLPARTTSGMPSRLVLHRGVVDRHLLAVGQVHA